MEPGIPKWMLWGGAAAGSVLVFVAVYFMCSQPVGNIEERARSMRYYPPVRYYHPAPLSRPLPAPGRGRR